MGKRRRPSRASRPLLPPLRLALLLTLVLAGGGALPRVYDNPWMLGSFLAAVGVLGAAQVALRRRTADRGQTLRYDLVPVKKVHAVQAAMQSSVYVYWAAYWPPVVAFAPMILAQLVFVYALDLLTSLWRRGTWTPGMGPFPIILSTNFFLWFKDDWFFLQFLMVAVGVLGKEFVRWPREGRSTHVFNPSALPLFLFSLGLIATGASGITWGQEIATTMGRPPYIYAEIFAVGLVVQYLFSVTLVTLFAAGTLLALSGAYHALTGVYYFIDTVIPVAVFLGLHLLVTDPATSPRTTSGRIVFGALYGLGVFVLYEALGSLDVPTFYDKLLCVPPLNLAVRGLDRAGRAVDEWVRAAWRLSWIPWQSNLVHMAVWIVLFVGASAAGVLGAPLPGREPDFWRRACEEGRRKACRTWLNVLAVKCRGGAADACFRLGLEFDEGRVAPREPLQAGRNFDRACDLGLPAGCDRLKTLARGAGVQMFARACDDRDGASCFILGSLTDEGIGAERNSVRATALFAQSCAIGWGPGCNRLGGSYLRGQGTAVDLPRAIESFEKACRSNNAAGCFNVAAMYERGMGTAKNDALALARFDQACELGLEPACVSAARSRSRPGASSGR